MKRKNSTFEYEEERIDDLMRAFHSCLASSRHVNTNDLLATAIMMPSRRFWVSEERATIVIADMLRGQGIEHMNANKQRMYREIHKRVKLLIGESADMPISHAVACVVAQEAPCFYMSVNSARKAYYAHKKAWYLKRFKRFRYLAGALNE